jgi:hypothetical protein
MEELELETPCTGSMNAAFMTALRRRRLLEHLLDDQVPPLVVDGIKKIKKFRARYLKGAKDRTVGHALEIMFQSLAAELAEGFALDDDFAGLMDIAIGDVLVQPTVFDMLEYKPPKDFGERLQRALARLRGLNPQATGYQWIGEAFRGCEDTSLRELLARPAPKSERPNKKRAQKAATATAD